MKKSEREKNSEKEERKEEKKERERTKTPKMNSGKERKKVWE